MRHKLLTALFYVGAALATANWLEYGLFEGYGGKILMRVAVLGSATFVVGGLVSLFQARYGVMLGSVAAILSWPYFAALSMYVPWRDLGWFVRTRDHGADQIVAIFFLLAATVYCLTQLRRLSKPQPTLSSE